MGHSYSNIKPKSKYTKVNSEYQLVIHFFIFHNKTGNLGNFEKLKNVLIVRNLRFSVIWMQQDVL